MTLAESKAPIVLVHGMWCVPEVFDEFKHFFRAKGYQVHTPRLPYHFPPDEMTPAIQSKLANTSFDEYVDSIVELVETLQEPPILIGHSMGGLIAQMVACKVKCKRLVLISSAAPAGINGWSWSVVKTFGRNFFKFPLWRSATKLNLANIRYGIANTQSEELQEQLAELATFESGLATWQLGMWFLYINPKNRVEYDQIDCPVLIIGGTADKITPIKIQQQLKLKYGNKATYEGLTGACHWTIGGRHLETVLNKISNWL